MALPKKYKPAEIEKHWQEHWLANDTYAWEPELSRDETFVIDTPPPTVSGLLHMGHIFSYTQADFVARYQRMSGKTVFYPIGFDDNGLPTERLVEKVKKVRGNQMPREEFIAICKEVVKGAEEDFRALFRSVALSVDWNQEFQTISDHTRRLSQRSFLDLIEKGEIIRRHEPMLWDPIDQTALAQADIEDHEKPGVMHYFNFTSEDGEALPVASTRPELLIACVAMFYHPDDERFQHLEGKHAISPLFNVKVPILADEHVAMDKGTGLVMCCTFGDQTDIDWWRTHKLPTRLVLNRVGRIDISHLLHWDEDGLKANSPLYQAIQLTDHTITDAYAHITEEQRESLRFTYPPYADRLFTLLQHVPEADACRAAIVSEIQKHYPAFSAATLELMEAIDGKKVAEARALVADALDEAGVMTKREPISHAVKCAERSGAPLEIQVTHQWFVKVMDKKEALLERAREINWHPSWMQRRLEQWIEGLSWDWCISRQRYFGVPFPVWYSKRQGEEGKILTAHPDDLPVNPLVDAPRGYSMDEVEPDPDVMDTWATSSISPNINSHGLNDAIAYDQARHKNLYPADLRPQAHEIIRTWMFYTVVKSHLHADSLPFTDAMISGWCLASDKTKMSKSKGNVVTPVALIEKEGADAVRYWASTSKLGTDTAYSEDTIKVGRKLATKIFNASKFVTMHLEKLEHTPTTAAQDVADGKVVEVLDVWVLSKLRAAIEKASTAFEAYEYSDARSAVEDFFWNDFCDNYLELCKARAYAEEGWVTREAQQSALLTLHHCLHTVLRLFAPIVPHITEEVYQGIFDEGKGSIHRRGFWPEATDYPSVKAALAVGEAAVNILGAVRKVKAEAQVSVKYPLDAIHVHELQLDGLEQSFNDLKATSNAASIALSNDALEKQARSDDGAVAISATLSAEKDAA